MAFFETLDSCNVPLIIFSAGIGNVIEIFLKQKFGKVLENVHIISNLMVCFYRFDLYFPFIILLLLIMSGI